VQIILGYMFVYHWPSG